MCKGRLHLTLMFLVLGVVLLSLGSWFFGLGAILASALTGFVDENDDIPLDF